MSNTTVKIVSALLIPFALADIICGGLWSHNGGLDGHGVWCGAWLAVTAVTGHLTWCKKKRATTYVFIAMAFVALVVCITQAVMAGSFYRKLRVLKEDSRIICQTIDDMCYCNKTDGSDVAVPLRLPSCDPLNTLTASILGVTLISAFGTLLAFAGALLPCVIFWRDSDDD